MIGCPSSQSFLQVRNPLKPSVVGEVFVLVVKVGSDLMRSLGGQILELDREERLYIRAETTGGVEIDIEPSVVTEHMMSERFVPC